jgi:hypothetical protein
MHPAIIQHLFAKTTTGILESTMSRIRRIGNKIVVAIDDIFVAKNSNIPVSIISKRTIGSVPRFAAVSTSFATPVSTSFATVPNYAAVPCYADVPSFAAVPSYAALLSWYIIPII